MDPTGISQFAEILSKYGPWAVSAFFMLSSVYLVRKCFEIYDKLHNEVMNLVKENNATLQAVSKLAGRK